MTHSPLTRRSPLPNPRPSPSPAACTCLPRSSSTTVHRTPSTTPLKSSPTTHHPHPHPPPPPTLASSLFIHPSFPRSPRPAPLPIACSTKTTFHWSNYLTPTFINPPNPTQHRAHHSTTTLRPPLTTHTHLHPFPPQLQRPPPDPHALSRPRHPSSVAPTGTLPAALFVTSVGARLAQHRHPVACIASIFSGGVGILSAPLPLPLNVSSPLPIQRYQRAASADTHIYTLHSLHRFGPYQAVSPSPLAALLPPTRTTAPLCASGTTLDLSLHAPIVFACRDTAT